MQGNSDKTGSAGTKAEKTGAWIAAGVIAVFAVAMIGVFVLIIKGEENAGLNGILGLYIAVLAAVAVGVLLALRQRLREIKNGEEEEAKKLY